MAVGNRRAMSSAPSSDLTTPEARPCSASPPVTFTVVTYSGLNSDPLYVSSRLVDGGLNFAMPCLSILLHCAAAPRSLRRLPPALLDAGSEPDQCTGVRTGAPLFLTRNTT